MSETEVKEGRQAAGRLLVICVDRDDDLGEKAGIKTPVVGRDSCIEAAQRLALEDPEDADSNAVFSAIKTYEDLVSRGTGPRSWRWPALRGAAWRPTKR